MGLKENKNNYYTKELNEVDRYLLRVIKRYFDIEQINNATSINAIIAEAIARYKSSINYKPAGVFALNNKVGIANININDLDGENKFDKMSAFNKDFGSTTDTICEGSDDRLFDKRNPTEHNHKIIHVNELREALDSFKQELVFYGNHLHVNLAIINKLVYTGTKTQIDLIELESLGSIVVNLIHILDVKTEELVYTFDSNSELIDDTLNELYLFMQRIYSYITDLDEQINKECINYYYENIKKIETINENILTLPKKIEATKLKDKLNRTYLRYGVKEISIDNVFDTTTGTVTDTESMKNLFQGAQVIGTKESVSTIYEGDEATARWEFNEATKSFLFKVNEDGHLMSVTPSEYKSYSHEVTLKSVGADNNVLSVILAAHSETYDNEFFIYPISLNIALDTGHAMSVVFGYQTQYQEELAYDNTFVPPANTKWSDHPNGIRIRIEKKDTVFSIYRSELNSTVVNDIPCITFDTNDIVFKDMFSGPTVIGYGCFSQISSAFSDVHFTGYKEVILNGVTTYTKDIVLQDVLQENIVIDTELVYNKTKVKLPYIANDFIIDAGIANQNKLYVRFQPLKEGAMIPFEITTGIIQYDINYQYIKVGEFI